MRTPFYLLAGILLMSCTEDKNAFAPEIDSLLTQRLIDVAPTGNMYYYLLPDSRSYHELPQDIYNPITAEKVALGQKLYFETGIGLKAKYSSSMQSYSCASCHIPDAGFTPGSIQGIGDGGMGYGVKGEERFISPDYVQTEIDIQSIRPLSMVNVAFVKNTFWSGQFGSQNVNEGTEAVWSADPATDNNHLGFEAIETQNIAGLIVHRFDMDEEIAEDYGYKDDFDRSFPAIKDSFRYSMRTANFAISAYLRTILSNKAPFQQWLKGDNDAMSADEKAGALLFFDKANCYKCHYEKNLGSMEFHALGVLDMDQNSESVFATANDKRNLGRGGFTLDDNDLYRFRVPGLYNVVDYGSYFHGSSKRSLEEVLEYKLKAEKENPRVPEDRISPTLKPVTLTEKEKSQLLAFIKNALRDPELNRYMPYEIGSDNCYPNNDAASREDLGCQ